MVVAMKTLLRARNRERLPVEPAMTVDQTWEQAWILTVAEGWGVGTLAQVVAKPPAEEVPEEEVPVLLDSLIQVATSTTTR